MLNEYPPISNKEDCQFFDQVRKMNAQLSHFMNIPFPEELDDDTWLEKYRQFEWLLENNWLPVQLKKQT